MRVLSAIAEVRAAVAGARRDGRRVALVPTMGALHEGHLSLVRRARVEAELVVMSVFVNPLQFGPGEDLARYPRDPEGDAARARAAGVDVLFAPTPEELYPHPPRVTVAPAGLDARWEGALRPGHFAGVLTVVLKLFHIVQPDLAVFGQKDFQQAAIVRAMVEDLDLPLRLVVAPIVREPDGLAMSSRNRYLAEADRREATRLSRALDAGRAAFAQGERDAGVLQSAARAVLEAAPAIAVDYLVVVNPATLEPVVQAADGDVILLAARVGGTRLLDNLVLGAP
ncbi:MAG TPA: pantoate--beta-alanine ligase [Gemmatimonadaceae bacterium]|nr:pantoate--beta-alanine ligase [Gemmatimonadaceae bacterium]